MNRKDACLLKTTFFIHYKICQPAFWLQMNITKKSMTLGLQVLFFSLYKSDTKRKPLTRTTAEVTIQMICTSPVFWNQSGQNHQMTTTWLPHLTGNSQPGIKTRVQVQQRIQTMLHRQTPFTLLAKNNAQQLALLSWFAKHREDWVLRRWQQRRRLTKDKIWPTWNTLPPLFLRPTSRKMLLRCVHTCTSWVGWRDDKQPITERRLSQFKFSFSRRYIARAILTFAIVTDTKPPWYDRASSQVTNNKQLRFVCTGLHDCACSCLFFEVFSSTDINGVKTW